MDLQWTPHVTVAAVIERDQRFLLVEEDVDGLICYNQPAGHWEYGETLIEAVIRETLEESAFHFQPENLLGIYQWNHPQKTQLSYLRFAFTGQIIGKDKDRVLDQGILRTVWLDENDVRNKQAHFRSPQVMQCIQDYLKGLRYPLDLISALK
ncbi:MAG: NUDIX hydrolase [Gammaproteobacteria bacterium]|nr:NUDIX hydrolase [Gammaproteobacteria bacterium]